MKNRFLLLLGSLLLLAVPSFSQTSNAVSFTAVSPPAPVITTLGGLSASGKIYTGSVIAINGTGFVSNCVVNVDQTAQPASTFAFISATLINYTVPAALGSTTGTNHTLTVVCTTPVLTLNSPGTLPNAKVGVAYSANLNTLLGVTGGVPPYSYSLSSGSLPTGLTLSLSGVVSGTPSGAGSSAFTITVKDSTGLTIKKLEFNSNSLDKKRIKFQG